MQPPADEPKKGAPEWVVTFGDMMSLLLCFFVLLLSFSTMETERFKVIAGYLREAFGVQTMRHYTEIPSGDTVIAVEFNPPTYTAEAIFEEVVQKLRTFGYEGLVEAERTDEGVRVRVDGELLFPPASTAIDEESMEFLSAVAATIKESGAKVIVEGHTDNLPIRSERFPSNWELSAGRAAAVVRFFESQGVPPARMQAVGYGPTRPVADNATPEGRRKNRRVEIVIQTSQSDGKGRR
ncbi:MAG: flagellar motor protein MotB [Acidobacteria bacterium]|nr:MAG: flagellar motor protein MotB [Acidobacteriota bacterium]